MIAAAGPSGPAATDRIPMDAAPRRPVPVFPLAGLVLFPRGELSLRVHELRYRTLVRDALSSERLLAIATLAPGWEREEGTPTFHPLGCVAQFEEVEWLPNDHYDLRVRGTMRVHFGRPVREYPYRACIVEALDNPPYTEDDPLATLARADLLAERTRLAPLGLEAWLMPLEFEPAASLATVCGVLATAARLPAEDKLALLEVDNVVERARLLRERLRTLGPLRQPPPSPGRN
jgi:Lon protease-like protein